MPYKGPIYTADRADLISIFNLASLHCTIKYLTQVREDQLIWLYGYEIGDFTRILLGL